MKENLTKHQKNIAAKTLKEWFVAEPNRVKDWTFNVAGIYADLSKNYVNHETKTIFENWWQSIDLKNKLAAIKNGDIVNGSEKRQVLHHLLREPEPSLYGDEIKNMRERLKFIVNKLQGFDITDVIHIGIGGSELGMKLITSALRSHRNKKITIHFLASPDAAKIAELQELNPHKTALIIASKSFTTEETLLNAIFMRDWLLSHDKDALKRVVAISASVPKVKEFGIPEENILPMWDWVGGRFSLSSALAIPLILQNSYADYEALLKGMHVMDEHFYNAPLAENLPVALATLDAWYNRFFNINSRAVITYNHPLKHFPAFLQQLSMESLGKNCDREGKRLHERTGLILWGGRGTESQHSFFQLLHQGNHIVPLDLITVKHAPEKFKEANLTVHSHFIAQAEALMQGRETNREEQFSEGNRPTSAFVLDKLTPETLGALISLYEHKTEAESFLYDVNAFDQWGVEFGKILAGNVRKDLQGQISEHDASTVALIEKLK